MEENLNTDQNVNPAPIDNIPNGSKKKWFLTSALIFLVVFILGFIFFKHIQSPQTTKSLITPASSPTPADETANWKTYQNSTMGISFSYPEGYTRGVQEQIDQVRLLKGSAYSFEVKKIDGFQTIDEWLNVSNIYLKSELIKSNVNFNSYDATFFEIKPENYSRYQVPANFYAIKRDGSIYTITYEINDPIAKKILSTFKFTDQNQGTSSIQNILIGEGYSFSIDIPENYILKLNQNSNSIARDIATISDSQGASMSIYTYAAGENSPVGKITIDGVPFTIDYSNDVKCLSTLHPTDWKPGTKPLFNIHLSCNNGSDAESNGFKQIIQSIKFNSKLRGVLMGNSTQ